MAAPVEINIEYTRGDSEPFVFALKDSDGVALDVSGSTFEFEVGNEDDGDSATYTSLFTLSATFVTDGTDGLIKFTPTSVNTDVEADTYFYDVQQETPTVRTIIKGTFKILVQVNTS
jgi:hypothetical protein